MFRESLYDKPPLNETTLKHFGVKGMKWGVRNRREKVTRQDAGNEGKQVSAKKAAKLDSKYEKKANSSSAQMSTQSAIARGLNKQLPELNSNPKFDVDLTDPKNKKVQDQYYKEFEKMLDRTINDINSNTGTNASGTRKLEVRRTGEGADSWYEMSVVDVKSKKVKHSDDLENAKILLSFDKQGRIIETEIVSSAVKHAIDLMNAGERAIDELFHSRF